MVFPRPIKKGCILGVIAPSGPYKERELKEIKEKLEVYGYSVKFGKSCYDSYKGYLSSEDKVRAKDIEYMFLDKDIDGIICIRGGYGTPRILELIDYNIIKQNPKIFIGFSDITALHIAFNQKCDLVTFHGIMAGSSYKWDDFSYESLINAINLKDTLEIKNPKNEKIKTIVKGKCEGKLIGGNLSLIITTMGTPFEIDTKGKILFIEEVGESIYRIDRMLTQLALGGKFTDCEGIIFGDFSKCHKDNEDDFELGELLKDRVEQFNKPCIYNLKSGHCLPMISLPLGANCKLNATNKNLYVER
ncbi:S66 peptidase family protein [Romboutsia sp.]|uniref:S66 peptidase family protein n=1 Tax=Romboutsia sp. TaxID=1965302 RepID=UPI003F418DDE